MNFEASGYKLHYLTVPYTGFYVYCCSNVLKYFSFMKILIQISYGLDTQIVTAKSL